jgi:hypothetical protein
MNTLSTLSKIFRVFGCEGRAFHVVSGLTLLRNLNGYTCPHCSAPVKDITDTPIGREYFAWVRPDLNTPPPKT